MTSFPKSLVVSVDTEEEGLWGGGYRVHGNTVENTRGIPRFQQLCDRLGLRPTYVVTTPIVNDDRSVSLLREIQDSGRCEIGAHLHVWCAPPFAEKNSRRNSYQCNLPTELQREKLKGLTERITERFGRRPTSFRAGRYGLDGCGAGLLAELGYAVDSSVIPFVDYSNQEGPDFRHAPFQPYPASFDDLCQSAAASALLEVPVSVGFNRRDFRRTQRILDTCRRPLFRTLRLTGILDRLGIIDRIKFSPEQADTRRMKILVDRYLEQGADCMVLMFHSSSLAPGLSPYVKDTAALDEFHRRIEQTADYCLGARGMQCRTLSELAPFGLRPRNQQPHPRSV